MANLNRVILIGNLTRDPELRYTPSGTPVANFTLAVNRLSASQEGERQVDFIPIVVWRKQAENCSEYLTKGSQVAVDGRLQIRSYEDKDGIKRRVAEVVAWNVQFLGRLKEKIEPEISREKVEGEIDREEGKEEMEKEKEEDNFPFG